MSNSQEVFEKIYREKSWGGRARFWKRFYSGSGSGIKSIIDPYIAAVSHHLIGKTVVDIGCGDFTIGRRLSNFAKHYIACDIARPLIEYNRKTFKSSNLEFRVLDAVEETLPNGDVVLVRQVLQHLDNDSVSKVLSKLVAYKTVIVTEHIPRFDFVPNVDMPTGATNRSCYCHSGLVLTESPFKFSPKTASVICEVLQDGGIIRTHLYEF